MNNNDKKTALYNIHSKLGAKLIPFAGYIMPVWYSSIKEEHLRVRNKVGIFDLSHMGEVFVEGKDALAYLQKLTPNDLSAANDWQCQYSMLMLDSGGVVDDLIFYKYNKEKYLIVINASNIDKDINWLMKHKQGDVKISHLSDEYSLIAIQGPESENVLQDFGFKNVKELKNYTFRTEVKDNIDYIFAATGYTGERGFELIIKNQYAEAIWEELFKIGKKYDMLPIGLGARDTLRMEVCFPLYGHELGEDISPVEANLKRFMKPEKGDFIGKADIENKINNGCKRKLRGFISKNEKDVCPRPGNEIFNMNGSKIGFVTSGAFAPSLNRNMGMAYFDTTFIADDAKKADYEDKECYVEVHGKKIPILVKSLPVFKKSK